MKRINKIAILFLVFLMKSSLSFSQIDTAFWFATPWVTPDHWHKDNYVLHISTFSAPTTTVRLRQPAAIAPNQYDTTIILGPNTNFDYVFWRDKIANAGNFGFDSLETRPANTVVPYGLYLSSSSNITVVFDAITRSPNFLNPETFSLKGQNGLGTEFVCPFQTRWRNQFFTGSNCGSNAQDLNCDGIVTQPKQQINIVATRPNTIVWITPKTNVVGHPANITYSIVLPNPGDAYTIENIVQNTNVTGNNLSGTIISSNLPIAVTVADDSVAGVTGCFDLMGDQIVPVDIVGTDYILNKGFMNAPEHEGAYIVGTENFTQITINDGVTTTTVINKGDTYHYKTNQTLTYVNATKPVYCLHASGTGCELGEALLPPLNCAGSNLVSFSRTNDQGFYLNLLCRNGAQGSFTLNNAAQSVNVPITAANFTVVPGTATLVGGPFYGAQLNLSNIATLPIGSYTVFNSTDVFALGVFGGNASTGGLFHYMSSFLRRTAVEGQTVIPVCVGSGNTVALTGTVSGGAITGTWTTANGTGSFGSYTSTLNVVSTTYSLSNLDTTLSEIKFYLTSLGSCTPRKDSILVSINQRPQVTILSTPTLQCKNNVSPIALTGSVTNATGGLWSGGNGGSFGGPGVNTTYTPSLADLAAGTVTLVLSSQGPSVGCNNSSKSFTIGFVDPPTISLLSSTIACTNSQSVALTGTVNGSNISYLWNSSGTGFFTPSSNSLNVVYNFSPADLTQSVINLTLTAIDNSGLCSNVTGNMAINIQAEPSLTVSPNFTICSSNPIINLNGAVSGGGASAVTWSTTNGTGAFTPVPPASANYNVSQNDTIIGQIKFYANSSGGFCPSVSDTVLVSIIKLPLLTVNPSTGVCQFTPIQLTGSVSGYTNAGVWSSTGTGTFSPSNTSLGGLYYPSNGDLSAGSVTITLSSATVAGITCPSSIRSFVATFVESPKADFSFSTKRCAGDPVSFINTSSQNNTNITSANWNFGNGNTSINTQSAQTTYTNPGIYLVTFTVTGTNSLNISCTDTVSRRITINVLPTADFASSNSCAGLTTNFTNLSLPANGNFNWFFGPAATPSVSTQQTPNNIIFGTAGIYNVELRITSPVTQCTASVVKSVSVNPQPNAEFGMTNNPTVAQEPVYYSDFSTATGSIVTWLWNFGDETTGSGPAPVHSYQNGGVYYVTLTIVDEQGCSDTTRKVIEVNLIPQVPTGFTPNADGNNDRLYVKGGPFNKMIFRIYNNWGEKVYESADQQEGWDGKKDGVDQPVGVYVWTLEVDLYNNRTVKKNGDVTLMR
jgi:gliding motility-associated-like protein